MHTATGKQLQTVLAIETSCDDTCLSLLECNAKSAGSASKPRILHSAIARSLDQHEAYGGIHPIVAVRSHDLQMPRLVQDAEDFLTREKRQVDLVCVTKGPGMRSSLQVGIDAATALARKLDIPLMAVHHMQAHALTPRLLQDGPAPAFPYLSLLVSGGHTLLLNSQSITEHSILASTLDIAAGDMVDKVAKALQVPWEGSMPGAALERWCRDSDASDKERRYVPVQTTPGQLASWKLTRPLHAKVNINGKRFENMAFSFSGLGYSITKLLKDGQWTEQQRKALGGEAMRIAFEHLAAKVVVALKTFSGDAWPTALVLSGGVARNQYLREILQLSLEQSSEKSLELIAPPLDLCSDNATMIAWAGFEMVQDGQASARLPIVPRPKWPLDLLLSSDADFDKEMAKRASESITVRRQRQNLQAIDRKIA